MSNDFLMLFWIFGMKKWVYFHPKIPRWAPNVLAVSTISKLGFSIWLGRGLGMIPRVLLQPFWAFFSATHSLSYLSECKTRISEYFGRIFGVEVRAWKFGGIRKGGRPILSWWRPCLGLAGPYMNIWRSKHVTWCQLNISFGCGFTCSSSHVKKLKFFITNGIHVPVYHPSDSINPPFN